MTFTRNEIRRARRAVGIGAPKQNADDIRRATEATNKILDILWQYPDPARVAVVALPACIRLMLDTIADEHHDELRTAVAKAEFSGRLEGLFKT